ncbi:hypothetical protein Shell_0112 [Staphylothermus hellenicus DSM 12710]|uniref:Uncharacterized protein n=2 Tax=Staphylothermus hellenicus TaxID=84599 RepID=D7DAR2_STAHD|nr:hypothetical protein Shell_0112 [Staphylothermus hellenicus DSM 12710]
MKRIKMFIQQIPLGFDEIIINIFIEEVIRSAIRILLKYLIIKIIELIRNGAEMYKFVKRRDRIEEMKFVKKKDRLNAYLHIWGH